MRRKIEIRNSTKWDTKELRQFVTYAAAELGNKFPKLIVEFKPGRTHKCRGYAYYNRGFAKISLPKDGVWKEELGQQLIVMFNVCLGYKTRYLSGPKFQQIGDWLELYKWAADLPLTQMVGPPKLKKKDKIELQIEAHQKKIETWKTKHKRATTMLKKYQKKLKYYEKRKMTLKEEAESRKAVLANLLDLEHSLSRLYGS